MLTARPVRRRFGAYLCRDCMIREYRVRLKRRDVIHREGGKVCPYCGATDRVVVGFTPTGLLKMLFVRARI